jgi:hypothetical protein
MSTRTTDYHVFERNPSRPHLHNKSGQIELALASAAQDAFTFNGINNLRAFTVRF